MEIDIWQIVALIVLVVSGSVGYIVANEQQKSRVLGPPIFIGKKGQLYLLLLGVPALLLFIGSAIYLGVTSRVLCAIAVAATLFVLCWLLSPIVWRVVVVPLVSLFELFSQKK